MNITLKIKCLSEIAEVAQQFVAAMGSNTVFAFYGAMGAGKTTFIKAICKELGTLDEANSPTFSIVNQYETVTGDIIFHFDCYRLNTVQEAVQLGFEEYFDSGNICLIEWAENIDTILPDDTVKVEITVSSSEERIVRISTTNIFSLN